MQKLLREIIRRVELWPEERQENAARVLLQMDAQVRSADQLTKMQIAEVKHRADDTAPRFLSLRDSRSRFAKRGA